MVQIVQAVQIVFVEALWNRRLLYLDINFKLKVISASFWDCSSCWQCWDLMLWEMLFAIF
jgi:hypothetical protein